MKLEKDKSLAARQVLVPCVGEQHEGPRLVLLGDAWFDLEGEPFVDYYCDKCAALFSKGST